MNFSAATGVRAGTVSGVVIRCGCSDEAKTSADYHGYRNVVCPNPRKIEDRGVIARTPSLGSRIKRFFTKE